MKLTAAEAKSHIEAIGPKLGYDYTEKPIFPEGRDDLCVVKHTAENGRDYGFDVVYLVWKGVDGSLKHREISSSRGTQDYTQLGSVENQADGSLLVQTSGGSHSGVRGGRFWQVTIKGDEAKIDLVKPKSFVEQVKQAMMKVVESHTHTHPLYRPTAIKEQIIEEERQVAVFILFEQIDTDRCAPSDVDEGLLGDQYRYSIWTVRGETEPVRIYEDHAYIRRSSTWASASDGSPTRGRDCSLKGLKLEGDVIKVTRLKGEWVEKQVPEEITFDLKK